MLNSFAMQVILLDVVATEEETLKQTNKQTNKQEPMS